MITLPIEIMAVLEVFAPVFSERIWDWVQVLVAGAILSPRQRTVTSALRAVGLHEDKQFQNYHRVLNRAKWSSLEVSGILFGMLVRVFVRDKVLVLASDETLERRRGAKIPHLGSFRDAARSTKGNKVKSFGLRWVSMMILSEIGWSSRIWALPFLTVLAPGVNSDEQHNRRHKTSIDWVRQQVTQVRRWLPHHPTVLVVDGGLASLALAQACQAFKTPVTLVTLLHHNARLFDFPSSDPPKQRGRKRIIGERFTKLNDLLADKNTPWQTLTVTGYGGHAHTISFITQVGMWHQYGKTPVTGRAVWLYDPSGKWKPCVLFASDMTATLQQIIEWFVMRWSVEVTFEESRLHLGFETQRQWNPLAILRTSPAILGLFSLVSLLAPHLLDGQPLPIRHTSWYRKTQPTFSDTLAYVRQHLWRHTHFHIARSKPRFENIPDTLLLLWEDILCHAS